MVRSKEASSTPEKKTKKLSLAELCQKMGRAALIGGERSARS